MKTDFINVDGSYYRRDCLIGVGKVYLAKGMRNPYSKNAESPPDTYQFKILTNFTETTFLHIIKDSENEAQKFVINY